MTETDPVTEPTITDTRSLFEALDGRPSGADAQKAFDEAVWSACEAEGTILVTDLSGFTRTTRTHGILHFLQMFRRFQVGCAPLIDQHGGTLLKQEADDLIGVFGGAVDGIRAAIAMMQTVETINTGLAEHEHIGLSLGIEHGRMLRLSDDAYGDPVNVAFKLGEDIADRGELLVANGAYEQARVAGFDFAGCTVEGPHTVDLGKVPVEHWSVRLNAGASK